MRSQADLAKMFVDGAGDGRASHMHISDLGVGTALVGYGWAIYAYREGETRRFFFFEGWRGYSKITTSKHLPAIRHHLPSNTIVVPEVRPQVSSFDPQKYSLVNYVIG